MKQNTKGRSKGPLIIKKLRGKKEKKERWLLLLFSPLFLKSVFFTLCFECGSNFLFYLQPLIWKEREREREVSPAGSKPNVQSLCVNTVCLGELELFIWEDMNPPSLIWALGSDLIGSWNSREKKKGNRGGGWGAKEREAGDEAHSPLAMGSCSFVRKAVHFWGPDTFFIFRCEAGFGSEFSLPVCFYKCVGCSANSVWKSFR